MRRVFTALLLTGLVIGTGCAKNSSYDDLPMFEKKDAVILQAGNIYEITENNFISGLDYEFTKEELMLWQNLLDSMDECTAGKKTQTVNKKYLIWLYDGDENEVATFFLDTKGILYSEDRIKIEHKAIMDMLQSIISAP